MVSAIDSAVSGLNAATTRLQVSANNTANQLTKNYKPEKVDQVTIKGGGVQAKVSEGKAGEGVQQDHEVVNQVIAAQTYKANLKTIQVANDMLKSLTDIKA